MRKIYFLAIALLFTIFTNAQNPIPNPSFETWTNSSYPDGCSGSSNITKSTTANTGQFAVKGIKAAGGGNPQLSIGGGNGFAVSAHYTYLNFYYIFNKAGSDGIKVSLFMDNDNSGITVGGATQNITTASATYKAFSVPITYTGSGETSATLDISLNNNFVGSYFIIDDVSLSTSPVAAIEEVEKESSSLHLFPNPANGFVQLYFDNEKGKETFVEVTDMLGKTVKVETITSGYLSLDVNDLPKGSYIVSVKNDGMLLTKRLMLQ